MKISKQSNIKIYIALFCCCVMTVILSSAIVINARLKNNIDFNSIKTSYTNYSFSNIYTYDEVPKYIAVVSELTVNAKEEAIKEKEEQQAKANAELLQAYLSAKKIEGCSEKTIGYYQSTIDTLFVAVCKPVCDVTTNDIRNYLSGYQEQRKVSRVTIDNMRRIFSSFFALL